ncbi:MAG: hypothetical protein RJB66_2335 [Pseudomonadota bacterium]
MNFRRLSATQNTFFFISDKELREHTLPASLRGLNSSELAQLACQKFGSGADGFVIVKKHEPNEPVDFIWDFYNKDGSSAEMCGNAARCMAFYVRSYANFTEPKVSFKTIAGVVEVKILENGNFSVKMPEHKIYKLWDIEKIDSKNIKYSYINTGVPHAVIEVESLERSSLLPLVKHFRYHADFGSAGANVSFFRRSPEGLAGVTFERGVENFTASCGTGVVAMALSQLQGADANQNTLEVQTPGGLLRVDLDSSKKFCWLTGPAGLDEEVELY